MTSGGGFEILESMFRMINIFTCYLQISSFFQIFHLINHFFFKCPHFIMEIGKPAIYYLYKCFITIKEWFLAVQLGETCLSWASVFWIDIMVSLPLMLFVDGRYSMGGIRLQLLCLRAQPRLRCLLCIPCCCLWNWTREQRRGAETAEEEGNWKRGRYLMAGGRCMSQNMKYYVDHVFKM